MDYLKGLNEAQYQAVTTTEGPLMVLAGAGSGKTRVLTMRIAHLITNGVDPFHILALTFTNKAAREMKERIAKVVGVSDAKSLWMGTFHSVFARILRSEAHHLGYPSDFTIYDAQDSLNVIKKVLKELQIDSDLYKPKKVQSRISSYKNNLITVRAYHNSPELMEADEKANMKLLGKIYKHYVEACFRNGAMDFGSRPHVVACHAGLECGIIGANYPQMDMVSFGPTIRGAHSPDEQANIESTQKFWRFLKAILENIPEKQ